MFALGHGRSPVQPEYALQSYFGVGYYLRYQGEGDPMTKIAESLQFKFVYGDKAYTANSLANALQFEDILQAKGITEYKVFIYETVIIAMGQSLENAIDDAYDEARGEIQRMFYGDDDLDEIEDAVMDACDDALELLRR
jgi:hypothetical protein